MKLSPESHLDHGLSPEHVAWLLARFGDREAAFVATERLPDGLADLACALHGPIMGDPPVPEEEVRYAPRGPRTWPSRLCGRPPRRVREVTLIAGPSESGEPCILYTAFGGPLAPREPGDPRCRDVEASRRFWAEHALSAG